eukprot:CAMPEP_0185195588 /NCGR_PEP_ID=MMETSP1140-20130426/35066_1 /TAXON_ID=298111 /ORGANISM="Pavlova sp., Strain CCMP459" /LENGTH=211 /DNA_ID=CAMNT_0027762569 /DNA_START=9 /DNA_END=644 /DNA_ORIENTATION=+
MSSGVELPAGWEVQRVPADPLTGEKGDRWNFSNVISGNEGTVHPYRAEVLTVRIQVARRTAEIIEEELSQMDANAKRVHGYDDDDIDRAERAMGARTRASITHDKYVDLNSAAASWALGGMGHTKGDDGEAPEEKLDHSPATGSHVGVARVSGSGASAGAGAVDAVPLGVGSEDASDPEAPRAAGASDGDSAADRAATADPTVGTVGDADE